MAYWVYGQDAQTGERTDPLFSEAATEEAARAEAIAQGMIVESVERHDDASRPLSPKSRHDGRRAAVDPRDGRSYEFTPEQCRVIGRLALYMTIAGILLMLWGAGQLLDGLVEGHPERWAVWLQGALSLAIGGLTAYAAAGFRLVVDTRDRDVDHLMAALSGLKLIYAIQVWVAGIALVIGAIGAIVLFVTRPQ